MYRESTGSHMYKKKKGRRKKVNTRPLGPKYKKVKEKHQE